MDEENLDEGNICYVSAAECSSATKGGSPVACSNVGEHGEVNKPGTKNKNTASDH